MKTADELVELALPSVLDGLRAEIKQTIDWKVKEQAAEAVSKHVQQYIQTEILPEITKNLIESKDGLISLASEMGPKITSCLTDALMNELKGKLEKSWERSNIFEALFK